MKQRYQLGNLRLASVRGLTVGSIVDGLVLAFCDRLFDGVAFEDWQAIVIAVAWLNFPAFLVVQVLRIAAPRAESASTIGCISGCFMLLVMVGLVGPLLILVALPAAAQMTAGFSMSGVLPYLATAISLTVVEPVVRRVDKLIAAGQG